MEWEWRAFFSDTEVDPLNPSLKEEIEHWLTQVEEEERTDWYYKVDDRESGLKLRNVGSETKPMKLELKVMLDEYAGIERWEKGMEREFKESGMDPASVGTDTLIQMLREELSDADPGRARTQGFMRKLETLSDHLVDISPSLVVINKKRRQIRAFREKDNGKWMFYGTMEEEPADSTEIVVVELADLEVKDMTSEVVRTYRSICVESNDKDEIGHFVDAALVTGNGETMGYPELVDRM